MKLDALRPLVRIAQACAAVALLATVLFFLLHYVGNQLPRDLAAQRFQTELASDRPDEGHAERHNGTRYKGMYEYCEMSGAVWAGAIEVGAESALRDAVVLRRLVLGNDYDRCAALERAVRGVAVGEQILKTRYWWGSKALYAIALRYASVYQIREFTRIATHVAYLLLAVSLLLLGPKVLLLAAPLVVFGTFFSGIEYWAGVANGFPYLWSVLFAAGLALLTRRDVAHGARRDMRGRAQEGGVLAGVVPVYCFAAGTVSSYLWLGDGHTFLALTWIGMVVWFAREHLDVGERTRRAVSCIILYGAGIVVCFTLGQAVKAIFLGGSVWSSFWVGLAMTAEASWSRSDHWMPTAAHAVGIPTYFHSFYDMTWPVWLPAHFVPTFVAVFSLMVSLGFAAFEVRRGRPGLLWAVLWIVGLISLSSLTFLIVEHLHYRTARFAFIPLALCLSCLVLTVRTIEWRNMKASLTMAWELPALLVICVSVSWYLAKYELSATAKMIESVEGMRPAASSAFDVYRTANGLVYVNEECGEEDEDAPFFVHVYPVQVADLPLGRQPYGFDNWDFDFPAIGRRDTGRCAALRTLPDYEIGVIHTGQYLPGHGRVWSESIVLGAIAEIIESVDHMRPIVSAVFDVYLDGNRLVYIKDECRDEDDAPFFLHVHPARVADLPPSRQPHGFDNLDFVFQETGFRDADRCAVVRTLPNYEIGVIHTGQYMPETGRRRWGERVGVSGAEPSAGEREGPAPRM